MGQLAKVPREVHLEQTEDDVWIIVGSLHVHVIRTDEGVVYDVYTPVENILEQIGGGYTFFEETREEEL